MEAIIYYLVVSLVLFHPQEVTSAQETQYNNLPPGSRKKVLVMPTPLEVKKQSQIEESRQKILKVFEENEQYLIGVSMKISRVANGLTRRLFGEVDREESAWKRQREGLVQASQAASAAGVASSRCVEALHMQDNLKTLDETWMTFYRCMHDLSDVGAGIETGLTREFVGWRQRAMEAAKAVPWCGKGLEAVDPVCSGQVSTEGVAMAGQLRPVAEGALRRATALAADAPARAAACKATLADARRRIQRLSSLASGCRASG